MMPQKSSLLRVLPSFSSEPVLVEKDQDVYDIIDLISFAHKRNQGSYDMIAGQFWDGNLYDTCRQLFDFCKENIFYNVETTEKQTVRSPRKILESSDGGDCKHYASFIGGVLDALRRQGHDIEWVYRFASYKLFNERPSHVFVVVFERDGTEIWIDPVLDYFDERRDFTFAEDHAVKTTVLENAQIMSGVGVGDTGASVKVVGGAIMAVAPAIAVVVPVGTIVAAAAEVVGGLMQIVGGLLDKYKTSTQVRWLTQLYQLFVLGQAGVTSDNKVNENYTLQAQSWFSLALGVPMYDRRRFDAIKTSVSAYVNLDNAPDTKNIDPVAVQHAYEIAQTMSYSAAPGGWADFPPANIMLTGQQPGKLQSSLPSSMLVNPQGQLIDQGQGVDWLPIILIGGVIIFLLND